MPPGADRFFKAACSSDADMLFPVFGALRPFRVSSISRRLSFLLSIMKTTAETAIRIMIKLVIIVLEWFEAMLSNYITIPQTAG